jgi:POT family proton-dependent oligopeptide transporter
MLQLTKDKKILLLLSFSEMWERFSYYGMRALLVLYLITQLGFDDPQAYALYAFFASIGYLGCLGFGYLSDHFFGPRYLVMLGGSIMMLGHLLMAFSFLDNIFLFIGLALIAIGTSAFKGNITNILGLAYNHLNLSHEKDKAYIFFYAMLNLGGLLASIICGTIGMKYSWHLGFGIAAIGMAIGLTVFYYLDKNLLGKIAQTKKPSKKNYLFLTLGIIAYILLITLGMMEAQTAIELVKYFGLIFIVYYFYIIYQSNKVERVNLLIILVLLVFFVVFYALEMQTGSLIVLFASRNVDLQVGNYEIAAATVDSINPLVVMILGFITYFLIKKNKKDSFVFRFALGLSMMPLSFGLLYLGTFFVINNKVSLIYLVVSMSLMAFGEIFIGPIIQSKASDLSPAKRRGLVFGFMMFSASYANIVGNFAAKYMSVEKVDGKIDLAHSLLIYQEGFLKVIQVTFIALIIFLIISPIFAKAKKIV